MISLDAQNSSLICTHSSQGIIVWVSLPSVLLSKCMKDMAVLNPSDYFVS